MVNLEPIDKAVQKRLFQKMKALGRDISYSDSSTSDITQQEMLSRTTFIKMTSNQKNPVILMGGEMKQDLIDGGDLRSGYDEIYGSRGSTRSGLQMALQGELTSDNYSGLNENTNKRPMPGVKSIDVTFKGGMRSHREAIISWTCWSFEDITRLTPHFLAQGKTVLLDWGWIYNKSSLLKVENLMKSNGLDKSAFDDYSEEIKKGGGDFDSMVGIIKNFEYTTRSDGGFDCQTILGSMGVSIIDNTIPAQELSDSGQKIDVKALLTTKKGREEIKKAYEGLGNEEAVLLDVNITLSAFMNYLDVYLVSQINDKYQNNIFITNTVSSTEGDALNAMGGVSGITSKTTGQAICTVENKFMVYADWEEAERSDKKKKEKYIRFRTPFRLAYVRWGWFEDNVLSKFTSMTSDKNILSDFRSIDGDKSVKIRNSKYLETIDFNKYILPGQTFPVDGKQPVVIDEKEYKIKGDDEFLIHLAEQANEYFDPFFIEDKEKKVPSGTMSGPNGEKVYYKDGNLYYKPRADVDKRTQFGYLRNMLVNTQVIKEAFSDIIGLSEAMDKMFTSLNTPLNYWSFELQTDPVRPSRIRIIDDQHSAIDFTKKIQSQRSVYSDITGQMINTGIFYFPIWRQDSIVKSQNVITKVNDEIALITMYGSNLDAVKYPNGAGMTGTKEGLALGGLNNKFTDRDASGLDTAFKNQLEIGNENGFASEPLTKQGSNDGVYEFLIKHTDLIKKSVEANTKNKEDSTVGHIELKYENLKYESSKPLPPINRMTSKEINNILLGATSDEINEFLKIVGNKYRGFRAGTTTVFESVVMKESMLDAISYLTTEHVAEGSGDIEQSLILPLEMELEIDGTGGIYPGNSYHSTYLPQEYQDKTVFQIFDVNHTVSSTGWTTALSGKMRTTYGQVLELQDPTGILDDLIANYRKKIEQEQLKKQAEKDLDEEIKLMIFGTRGTPDTPIGDPPPMYYDASQEIDTYGEEIFGSEVINKEIGVSYLGGGATFTNPWGLATSTDTATGVTTDIKNVDEFFGPHYPSSEQGAKNTITIDGFVDINGNVTPNQLNDD